MQAQPANDMCSAATVVSTLPYDKLGNTVDATPDVTAASCSVAPTDQGVWYTYTPPSDKILQIQVQDATFDTRLVTFKGTCDNLICQLTNNGSNFFSFLSFAGLSQEEYKILVTGVSGKSGSFNIGITVCTSR